jgi:HTH-type transcriptional regulator, cell division transcriptional repressor
MEQFRIVAKPQYRLIEALDAAQLKAPDLAERSGLSKSTISRYLSGECEPKNVAVHKMAMVLHVDERWLMGYDVSMERQTKTETSQQALSPEENELLALYRDANDAGQQQLLYLARLISSDATMKKSDSSNKAM